MRESAEASGGSTPTESALLEAMKVVQAHVDSVAAITGQPHSITFTGGGCKGCSLAGLMLAIQSSTGDDDVPEGTFDDRPQRRPRRTRHSDGHGGGDH
jgi:hypothetical protein